MTTSTEEEEKVKKLSPFDYINDLTYDKKYLLKYETEKEFNIFMVNRGMGQQPDLIMLANEMNKSPGLSREMVHDFYFYAIKSKKRYGKWAKATNDNKEEIELLMKHYTINRTHAESYLKLLTDDEFKSIKSLYVYGGRSKK